MVNQILVLNFSDIWSFRLWSTLPGQNRGPYIRNPVYIYEAAYFHCQRSEHLFVVYGNASRQARIYLWRILYWICRLCCRQKMDILLGSKTTRQLWEQNWLSREIYHLSSPRFIAPMWGHDQQKGSEVPTRNSEEALPNKLMRLFTARDE